MTSVFPPCPDSSCPSTSGVFLLLGSCGTYEQKGIADKNLFLLSVIHNSQTWDQTMMSYREAGQNISRVPNKRDCKRAAPHMMYGTCVCAEKGGSTVERNNNGHE